MSKTIGRVSIHGKPFAALYVRVTLSAETRLRAWIAVYLFRLAIWIGGGRLNVETSHNESG